ncbi:MAG: DUF5807 family protein [Halobacteriaceae archaeon]
MSRRAAYLAGERPGDVALYVPDRTVDDPSTLADHDDADRLADGSLLVVDGERGRRVLARLVGGDPMEFAQEAGRAESPVARDLTGGTCPEAGQDEDHAVRFVFSFAEAHHPEDDGIYAEGPVIHAYARCTCDAAYSDRWVADASESTDASR